MANSLTCLHKIVATGVAEDRTTFLYCVSCDLNLTKWGEFKGRLYEHDIDYGVWVHVPGRRVQAVPAADQ